MPYPIHSLEKIPGLSAAIARALEAWAWREQLGPIEPSAIETRAALGTLPVLRKSDLPRLQRASLPFGGFEAKATSGWGRLYLSPGPIFEAEPDGSDPWGAADALADMGLRRGDVVLNTFSYHLTPGAFIFDSGARHLGCAVIPAGPGNTEQQLDVMQAYWPSVYVGTADFLSILIDAAEKKSIDTSCISTAILSGAAFPQALRERFGSLGIRTREVYAAAEVGIIAYSLPDSSGLVVSRDLLVEIADPATGAPLEAGEVGEVVVTCLRPRRPVVRLALGDLSAFLPQEVSGRPVLKGWLGRIDQATKVKGMFVRPEQVREINARHPEIARLRLVVRRAGDADVMTLHAEAGPGAHVSVDEVGSTLASVTKLKGIVQIDPAGSIPDDGRLIVDERPA